MPKRVPRPIIVNLLRRANVAVYVVTWNLNKERSNYDQARREFISHLEKIDNIDDPGLESTRFLSSAATAEQIASYLHQKLDDSDCLFVSKLNSAEHWGWLTSGRWDWIGARM